MEGVLTPENWIAVADKVGRLDFDGLHAMKWADL